LPRISSVGGRRSPGGGYIGSPFDFVQGKRRPPLQLDKLGMTGFFN
jgi:hypothetical protein